MNIAVVIPNWNGERRLVACLDAVYALSGKPQIIVVDNGSTDSSVKLIEENYPEVDLIKHTKNRGFAGGVNSGILRAKELDATFVALLNNDALPDKNWLKELANTLDSDHTLASAASLMLSADKQTIDSTGDFYTTWGLTFARQRDQKASQAYPESNLVFGASAGAALYRLEALEDIGYFDENFFAYYEDTDLNFRLQLAGWKSRYNPKARVSHKWGSTSSALKGFTTYQTFKNLPLILWKNVPIRLLPIVFFRFHIAYTILYINSLARGRGWPATKGVLRMLSLLPATFLKRRSVQKNCRVSVEYISSILVHDLPPNAHGLRKLRSAVTFGIKK